MVQCLVAHNHRVQWYLTKSVQSPLLVNSAASMRLLKIEFRRPQMFAAGLLFLFAVQCLWVVHYQTLTGSDSQYARCGRELWEKPSPLAGYLTSCGNISDGTFAYRAAGLPLTLERLIAGLPSNASPWEIGHLVRHVLLMLRLPFILFGVWLGGAIWWVSRRLYGNRGAFIALALYCFSPEVIRACVHPNNEILAAWGLYGVVYTAIGMAHTMQGPTRKWRPRLILLAVALGLTATAHIAAAVLGLLVALGFMLYLAEEKRPLVLPVLTAAAGGALFILFASYTFNLDAMSCVFQSADALLWPSWSGAQRMFASLPNAGISIAAVVSVALYLVHRRSRYFGNTTPLMVAGLLLSLETMGVRSQPWIWAVPFLLTFIGGIFADLLESKQRGMFLKLAGAILITQGVLCVASLRLLAR